ncbi:MAG: hypothetical protein LBB61_09555 [Treponema sp.]|jgi:histidinol dehydrogenase|nr:hypothetical protein [Treponema sp.]
MTIFPVENHRNRENGSLIYPVYSRRSGGLSIGINLFPDKKVCAFNCPYCEVFPFSTTGTFTMETFKKELMYAINSVQYHSILPQDICFSGNGEPTLSPHFRKVVEVARSIQKKVTPETRLVVITCGAGLFQNEIFSYLRKVIVSYGLNVWLKLDAGTEEWYRIINRSAIAFDKLIAKIKEFVQGSPVTLQTMLCSIGGALPSEAEEAAWNELALEMAKTGNVKQFQLYGKLRPSAEDPLAEAAPESYLEKRAKSLKQKLIATGVEVPVAVYV